MPPSANANRAKLPVPLEMNNETFGGSLIQMTYLSDYPQASIPTLQISVFNSRFFPLFADFFNARIAKYEIFGI